MKKYLKVLLSLYFLFGMSIMVNAQSPNDEQSRKGAARFVQNLEKEITLTTEEIEKIKEFKFVHISNLKQVNQKYKETPEFKAKRQEATKIYNRALVKAFGNERAKEIIKASKKKK
ncbi:hypothetical protein SAMN04489722_101306 [Algibacter lectus]|uniref:hypothetical protein n=1 Tax=Algibacter lectus TaxID=221126 RepID=UPI0008E4B052|nr:hypothetical protein [Algibacter lectus]SFB93702.1 hypothetical protein SAMN04489722_101306 [Algibacter lectus]